MDKKKLTSWGVSFGSLALVAGMVGYLGITNKNTTTASNVTTAQTQVNNQNSISQSANNLTLNQTANNSGSDQSSSNQHHGSFDTTTGGS